MHDPPGCIGASDTCETEATQPYGSAADPVTGYDGGTINIVINQGGYCTPHPQAIYQGVSTTPDPAACDPNSTTSCGSCATCLDVGAGPGGDRYSECFRSCMPSMTEQTCDHDGQDCDLSQHVCLPYGCHSDAECRVYRADTNMNGTIDPVSSTNPSGDHLVYDTDSMATCNTTTFRCESPGATGATAGIMCDKDSQCEQNGTCFTEASYGWPGGYCTRFGCDVAGNECTDGDVCQSHGLGVALCLKPCTVGNEDASAQLGPSGHGDTCRAGYNCAWNGTGGSTNNGGCIPGEYNDVTTPNVGAPCADPDGAGPLTAASQCYSPFGAARCFNDSQGFTSDGYCTITDCDAPGLPADVCGTNAECAVLNISATDTFGLCLSSCTTGDDCRDGYGCFQAAQAAMIGINATGGTCFPNCINDANCPTGQTCVGASMTALGVCMGTRTTVDAGVGDAGPADAGPADAGVADAAVSG